MTGRGARSRMSQAVAHGGQLANRLVQFVRFGRELSPINAWPSVRREHECDLLEREAGGATQRDECEALHHAGLEQTTQASPARRGNESLFFIEAQCRNRNARALRYFSDI